MIKHLRYVLYFILVFISMQVESKPVKKNKALDIMEASFVTGCSSSPLAILGAKYSINRNGDTPQEFMKNLKVECAKQGKEYRKDLESLGMSLL